MDQAVLDALAKWPNVPACTGWLHLDRRGQWRMRDEACQAAGTAGEPIRHVALKAFIERNYEGDSSGRWFFQNGPQRVFVDLAYTPWVVRLHAGTAPDATGLHLIDQCGARFEPEACWLDDEGNVLFSATHPGATVALLHDHDLGLLTDYLDMGDETGKGMALHWPDGRTLPVEQINGQDVPGRFAFVQRPA